MSTPALLLGFLQSREIGEIWKDQRFVDECLAVERAWILAAIETGNADRAALTDFDRAASAVRREWTVTRDSVEDVGRPVEPLVKALARGAGAELDRVLHLGLSTQDVIDAAMVRLRRASMILIERDAKEVLEILRGLSEEHRDTLMLGRTNGQSAAPVTLGLVLKDMARDFSCTVREISRLAEDAAIVSLSGPVGLSRPFGADSDRVRAAAARHLKARHLPTTVPPGQTRTASFCVGLVKPLGVLARMASFLQSRMQSHLREMHEAGSGKSSSMPHKRNPRRTERILFIHKQAAAQLPAIAEAVVHPDLRNGDAWMALWQAQHFLLCHLHSGLLEARALLSGLVVDTEQMAETVNSAGMLVFSDRLLIKFSREFGRTKALCILKSSAKQIIEDVPDFQYEDSPEKLKALILRDCRRLQDDIQLT